jgi:hypothetical protein
MTTTGQENHMDIAVENLPPYEQISNEPIREAVAQLSAARAALDEAKKSHTQVELELPASEWKDAEIAAEARRAAKPEPKTRAHTAKHEQRIRDLAAELKVSTILEQRALEDLHAAIDEHGEAWGDEVRESLEALRGQWAADLNEVIALHGRFSAALSVSRTVLGERSHADKVGFSPAAIRGIEFASGQARQTGYVATPDVLAALVDLGMPVVEPAPVEHPPLKPMWSNADDASRKEQAERRAFFEHAASPEGRRQVEEARRERAELHRQQNEMAEDAEGTAGD